MTSRLDIWEKKGTKRWIESPEDLIALNRSFTSEDEVTLWCETRLCESKRKKGDDDNEPTCSKCAKHECEVDEAFQILQTVHPDMEKPKLKLWARLINNGQHESYEDPPKIPLFTFRRLTTKESLSDVVKSAATAVANVFNRPSLEVTTNQQASVALCS